LDNLLPVFRKILLMKRPYLHLILLALFGLSSLTATAAQQLASAKVLSMSGTVTSESEDGVESPLMIGTILGQGDSIVTGAWSTALLVFSNGSEILVTENSSITIVELSQEAFGGTKSYEQLKADPSKSQSLLQLNYGKISGHVKSLKAGSRFDIETPLGTAAIRGTKFVIECRYDAKRLEYNLIVNNLDGRVDIISRYPGAVKYGRDNYADKGFDPEASEETEALPPAHKIIIRFSSNNPNFERIVSPEVNFPPFKNNDTQPEVPVLPPEVTPEDQDTVVASPNQPG
jgi:hypothetical protein